MGIANRSLALGEIKESHDSFIDLLPEQYLSISNLLMTAQPACQVVKVSGTITVSF